MLALGGPDQGYPTPPMLIPNFGLPQISGTVEVSRAAETTDTALKPLTEERVHRWGWASTRANGKFSRAVTNHSFDFWLWTKEQHEAEGKPGNVQVVEQLWNSGGIERRPRLYLDD